MELQNDHYSFNYVSIARRAKGAIGQIQFLEVCLETIILRDLGIGTHSCLQDSS